MTGRLAIVGLGPGAPELVTPLASETLTAASDLVGYAPYLARVPERPGDAGAAGSPWLTSADAPRRAAPRPRVRS